MDPEESNILPREITNADLYFEVQAMRGELTAMRELVKQERILHRRVVDNLLVGNEALALLFDLSRTTINHLRVMPPEFRIPYGITPNKQVYYEFDEIYRRVSEGRVYAKGFSPEDTLMRMDDYRWKVEHGLNPFKHYDRSSANTEDD